VAPSGITFILNSIKKGQRLKIRRNTQDSSGLIRVFLTTNGKYTTKVD
jgi:hypothetical protein